MEQEKKPYESGGKRFVIETHSPVTMTLALGMHSAVVVRSMEEKSGGRRSLKELVSVRGNPTDGQ